MKNRYNNMFGLLAYFFISCSLKANAQDFKIKKTVFKDNFSSKNISNNWFAELGDKNTNKATIVNKCLDIDVDYGATIWCKTKLGEAWMIEYDRMVTLAGGKNDRLADFNMFWQATDPNGNTFFGKDPKFANYDTLMLYYLGMGGHKNTTTRFRKYEGNSNKDILIEYTDKAHLLNPNKWYHCRIVYKNGISWVYINDKLFIEYNDPMPIKEGYFGFRTTESHHVIDNFKIVEIE